MFQHGVCCLCKQANDVQSMIHLTNDKILSQYPHPSEDPKRCRRGAARLGRKPSVGSEGVSGANPHAPAPPEVPNALSPAGCSIKAFIGEQNIISLAEDTLLWLFMPLFVVGNW